MLTQEKYLELHELVRELMWQVGEHEKIQEIFDYIASIHEENVWSRRGGKS